MNKEEMLEEVEEINEEKRKIYEAFIDEMIKLD